tara:strand:+ start:508 stop:645 length:138 start_codon:yes stop_codon:yes gene_type:complete
LSERRKASKQHIDWYKRSAMQNATQRFEKKEKIAMRIKQIKQSGC